MSGEAYGDLGYMQYVMDDVADRIGTLNPAFGELLRLSNFLVESYNLFESGDIGPDDMDARWERMRGPLAELASSLGPVSHGGGA